MRIADPSRAKGPQTGLRLLIAPRPWRITSSAMECLPKLALSVRQPWAWAIIAGHKPIENRSAGAIRSGNMRPGRICLHAAKGLKQDEFQWGHWRLAKHGVSCPRPETLPRGAIIGTIEVVEIIDWSDSEWFGGQLGLVLRDPVPIEPIPAPGALGYFEWASGGDLVPVLPWMKRFDPMTADAAAPGLFDDLPLGFETAPKRPSRRE